MFCRSVTSATSRPKVSDAVHPDPEHEVLVLELFGLGRSGPLPGDPLLPLRVEPPPAQPRAQILLPDRSEPSWCEDPVDPLADVQPVVFLLDLLGGVERLVIAEAPLALAALPRSTLAHRHRIRRTRWAWDPARIPFLGYGWASSRKDGPMRWVVFVHVAIAFWFVGGLIGRGVTLARARSSADIAEVGLLVELAGRFERLMVIPGSMAVFIAGLLAAWAEDIPLWGSGSGWLAASIVIFLTTIPLVPLIFLPRGKVFEAALADARAQGRVTAELTTAFHDPAVAFARIYEGVAIAVIVALMVTKPF
jgi:Predicted integral membrane protein (DUF2269)